LVKETVNFDDPGTHHFYYGDTSGHSGTILTFFPFVSAGRGRSGSGMVDADPARSVSSSMRPITKAHPRSISLDAQMG
jgi:catechol 2,3-dioxygenase-like lactoylglutathione lyase family enzyme